MAKKLVKMDDDRKMGEKINDNRILGESHFARGLIIKPSTRIQKPTKGSPAGRSMELITSLKEAGYMTLSSVSIAMQCNRQKSKTFLNKLHSAGLVEYSEIVTERGIFGLWQISGTTKPLNRLSELKGGNHQIWIKITGNFNPCSLREYFFKVTLKNGHAKEA